MTILYDNLELNKHIVLDLPFREGIGAITQDIAKPHHPLTFRDPGGGSFAWGSLATGAPYLEFVTVGFGATDGVYLDCPAASTLDLDFTSEDYSVGAWIYHEDTGHFHPKILIGRYAVDSVPVTYGDGWEIYLERNVGLGIDYLEQRHHHFSLAPNHRTGCYSVGWATGRWDFMGISCHKEAGASYPQHYRNAVPLDMSYVAGGILNPDTANRDLVIGARFTKESNWYKGKVRRLRLWRKALSLDEWKILYELEKGWFE